MPDECDVPGADLLDGGDDIVAERGEVPVIAPDAGLAVATRVDGDDAVPLGEEVDLVGPVGAVARSSMDEHHNRCVPAGASVGRVRDLDAVAAPCHVRMLADASWLPTVLIRSPPATVDNLRSA
jgi:hypothetical protein